MLGRISFVGIILVPIFIAIPAFLLYFIIKMAVKHAFRELKDENIL